MTLGSIAQLSELNKSPYPGYMSGSYVDLTISPELEREYLRRRQALQRQQDFDKCRLAKRPYKQPKARPLLSDHLPS